MPKCFRCKTDCGAGGVIQENGTLLCGICDQKSVTNAAKPVGLGEHWIRVTLALSLASGFAGGWVEHERHPEISGEDFLMAVGINTLIMLIPWGVIVGAGMLIYKSLNKPA